jgi:hypothetical protein
MEIKDIERLVEKQRLTAEDKAAVKAEAERLGITYTLKQGCRQCWDKLLLKIYDAHREDVEAAVSLDRYRLKNPLHGFRTYNGELFDNNTVTDKVVGKLHPHIVREYFVKVETKPETNPETESDVSESEI